MNFDKQDNLKLLLDDCNPSTVTEGAGPVTEDAAGVTECTGIGSGWHQINEFKCIEEMDEFLQAYTHKVTSSHGNQVSKCKKHVSDGHVQTYGYLRCSSVKCLKVPGDSCSFSFKV